MPSHDLITKRFAELEAFMNENVILRKDGRDEVNVDRWDEWLTNVMNLLERAFGTDSVRKKFPERLRRTSHRLELQFQKGKRYIARG